MGLPGSPGGLAGAVGHHVGVHHQADDPVPVVTRLPTSRPVARHERPHLAVDDGLHVAAAGERLAHAGGIAVVDFNKAGSLVKEGTKIQSELKALQAEREKQIKDMTKRVDLYKTQDQKRGRELSALQEEKAALEKKASALETELRALKQELAEAKAAAAESIALQEEHKAVKTEAKKLRSENKTLQENFESERRQRKKLYNKLEEMKGKIRVFCRVRPMSSSETQRGAVNNVA